MASRSLGTLTLDLIAKIGGFVSGMTEAERVADRKSREIAAKNKQRAREVQAAWSGVGSFIGGVFAGIGFAGLTSMVKAVVGGIDALNDFSDATGASVENASALEDVARRTGASLDTVQGILVKFNNVLKESKPGQGADEVLKQLGLNAQELKKLDPAEALRQTAVALSRFADDGNKARAVQELFGKSVKEAAPFLRDLAEAGELNATVTKQQADEAEKLNKQFFELQKNVLDASRSLVSDLVPALNQVFDNIKQNGGLFKSFIAGISLDSLSIQRKSLENLNLQIARTQSLLDDFSEAQVKEPGNRAYSERVKQLTEDLARMRKEAAAASESLKAAANALSPLENRPTGRRPPNEGGGRYVPPTLNVPNAPTRNRRGPRDPGLTPEQIFRLQLQAEEDFQKESAEAWDIYTAGRVRETEERTKAEAAQWKQVFETIDQEQEDAIEAGKAFLKQRSEDISDFAKNAAENIQRSLGDILADGMKGSFKDIADAFTQMINRMVAEALAAKITESLFGKGGSGGGLFGNALGAFGKILGFAGGGFPPVGRASLVGEEGPELFVPNTAGRIIPAGETAKMMGGMSLTQNFAFSGAVDQRTQSQVAAAALRGAQTALGRT
jgi:hypothetical protein